jgi:hypothetical protein
VLRISRPPAGIKPNSRPAPHWCDGSDIDDEGGGDRLTAKVRYFPGASGFRQTFLVGTAHPTGRKRRFGSRVFPPTRFKHEIRNKFKMQILKCSKRNVGGLCEETRAVNRGLTILGFLPPQE